MNISLNNVSPTKPCHGSKQCCKIAMHITTESRLQSVGLKAPKPLNQLHNTQVNTSPRISIKKSC